MGCFRQWRAGIIFKKEYRRRKTIGRRVWYIVYYAIDKKPITDVKLGFMEHELLRIVLKKVKGTDIEILLRESGLIE